jgi:hypothetical protein
MKNHRPTQMLPKALVWAVAACLVFTPRARPELVSSRYARGYAAIPEPQQVELEQDDFRITPAWRVEWGRGVEAGSAAIETLQEGFEDRHGIKPAERGSGPAIRLEIRPNSVLVGEAQDKDRGALAGQAYRRTTLFLSCVKTP